MATFKHGRVFSFLFFSLMDNASIIYTDEHLNYVRLLQCNGLYSNTSNAKLRTLLCASRSLSRIGSLFTHAGYFGSKAYYKNS